MQSTILILGLALVSAFLICMGASQAVNPRLAVRVYRKIFFGDYYIKSAEWETKMSTTEGRLGGCLFLFTGLGGVYVVLQLMGIIK
jgi:hypothetical protein